MGTWNKDFSSSGFCDFYKVIILCKFEKFSDLTESRATCWIWNFREKLKKCRPTLDMILSWGSDACWPTSRGQPPSPSPPPRSCWSSSLCFRKLQADLGTLHTTSCTLHSADMTCWIMHSALGTSHTTYSTLHAADTTCWILHATLGTRHITNTCCT